MKQLLVLFCVFLIADAAAAEETLYSGKTMDTTYHIKVVPGLFKSPANLGALIDKRLNEVNQSMSIFLDESEISRFNADSTGRALSVSEDFFSVMTTAEKLYTLTNGAWDGTVKPVIHLWGFGKEKKEYRIPSNKEIAAVLSDIGFNFIKRPGKNLLQKTKPSVTVDLSSIAKGYAVDQIAVLLKNKGFNNFIVEVGGEVYASGFKETGENWRVGVNTPKANAPVDHVYKATTLYNKALATSGDYRNFFEKNNKHYSHIIDPRTGKPVSNGVVSVSILANTCAFADGLATAVMVMGHENGLELVERLDGVEALIIVEDKNGRFINHASKGFITD